MSDEQFYARFDERTKAIQGDIADIKSSLKDKASQAAVEDIKTALKDKYVTQDQFHPVKHFVYGAVGFLLTSVLVGLVAWLAKGP